MSQYEILLMLDPEVAEGRQEEILTRARELIERGGGTWVRHDLWGRRRLAYEIDHKREGTYHLLQFDADAPTLDELARILRITDGVIRHLATRRIEGSQTFAPPEPDGPPLKAREVPAETAAAETAAAETAEPAETESTPDSATEEPEPAAAAEAQTSPAPESVPEPAYAEANTSSQEDSSQEEE